MIDELKALLYAATDAINDLAEKLNEICIGFDQLEEELDDAHAAIKELEDACYDYEHPGNEA